VGPRDVLRPAYNPLREEDLECPSVIFCQLPSDDTRTYNVLKMFSNYIFGIQSQMWVKTKFEKQNRPEQFCSNIALKLNTKLSNKVNKAQAWRLEGVESVKWLREVPTMVMGLNQAKAPGRDQGTVVVGAVCLGSSFMRLAYSVVIQKSAGLIEEDKAYAITKSLLKHFFQDTDYTLPQRLLVYRSGILEADSHNLEVMAIRRAFHDFKHRDLGYEECRNARRCQGQGCICCTPPITFVVGVSHHNIRVVPTSIRERNVHSGTCVESPIQEPVEPIPPPEDSAGVQTFDAPGGVSCFDFLLTAHQGIKGTSKTVLYKTLLNENVIFRGGEGSTPLTAETLKLVTYHMSFQYGTATKAVRLVPVLCYSGRLASNMTGYYNYILHPDANDIAAESMVRQETDGVVSFVRSSEIGSELPTDLKTEVLAAFSPCDRSGLPRVPFHSHLAA